jgi:hypothetical protein
VPSDYPNTPIKVSLVDDHPEHMKIHAVGTRVYNFYTRETGLIDSISIDRTFPQTRYISFEGIDTAGNTVVQWHIINSTATVNTTREMQPFPEKLNDTHIRFSTPLISENVTATLQISENYGSNWLNIPFTENNSTLDKEYAYYQRNSDELLYRGAINAENAVHYVHNIKSFHWDNTIYSIESNNVTTYTRNYQSFEINLRKSQLQNNSITLQWFYENNTLISEEYLGYQLTMNQRIKTNIPDSLNEIAILRVLINNSFNTWSTDFQVIGGYPGAPDVIEDTLIAGNTEYFNPQSVGTLRNKTDRMMISFDLDSKAVNQSIGFHSFSLVSFSILHNQDFKILLYDGAGNLLREYSYQVTPDDTIPQIQGISEVNVNITEIWQYIIEWVVIDNALNQYFIYRDHIIVESGYFDNDNIIVYETSETGAGNYNYTLLVYDKSGNANSFTTFLHVLEENGSTFTSSSVSISSSTTSNTILPSTSESKSKKSENLSISFMVMMISLFIIIRVTKNKF